MKTILEQIRDRELDIDTFLNEQGEVLIQDRMFSRVSPDLDMAEGSYIWDSVVPSSFEFALAYIAIKYGLDVAFLQTGYGEYTSMQAAAHGSPRREAVAATGVLTVTGAPGTKIPSGTLFSTTVAEGSADTPKYYHTLEDCIIPDSRTARIPIEAEELGSAGNVAAGEIDLNIKRITGIFTVTNEEALEGGIDEEDDDTLKERALERVRNPPSSGNKADYRRWAKEVAGVGSVIVLALHNGPGTVKVVVTDQNGGPASDEILAAVEAYIDPPNAKGEGEGKAPIGAVVSFGTVTAVQILVTIPGMLLEAGYTVEDVQAVLERRIQEYLMQIDPKGVVRIKDIEAIINGTAGVVDFDCILINNQQGNLQLGEEETATLGEVVIQQ